MEGGKEEICLPLTLVSLDTLVFMQTSKYSFSFRINLCIWCVLLCMCCCYGDWPFPSLEHCAVWRIHSFQGLWASPST